MAENLPATNHFTETLRAAANKAVDGLRDEIVRLETARDDIEARLIDAKAALAAQEAALRVLGPSPGVGYRENAQAATEAAQRPALANGANGSAVPPGALGDGPGAAGRDARL